MRAIVITAAAVLAFGQVGTQPFVGTWTAEMGGDSVVRVELSVLNGAVSGRVAIGNFQVDAKGELNPALPLKHLVPLSDVSVRGSTLLFALKDLNDTAHFEMKLDDDQHASLRLVLTEAELRDLSTDGISVQPVSLNKVTR